MYECMDDEERFVGQGTAAAVVSGGRKELAVAFESIIIIYLFTISIYVFKWKLIQLQTYTHRQTYLKISTFLYESSFVYVIFY